MSESVAFTRGYFDYFHDCYPNQYPTDSVEYAQWHRGWMWATADDMVGVRSVVLHPDVEEPDAYTL